MSGLRITLAVVYGCLFGIAVLIGVAAMKAPGGSTGFAWVALMGMPWSMLAMLLPHPPSNATIVLAKVWLFVICPLINISLLLGLHRRWRPDRSDSEVQSVRTEPARWRSLLNSLVGWSLLSILIAYPVSAVYGFFFSLPHPVVQGNRAVGLAGVNVSLPFVCMEVWMRLWPCLSVVGMGLCVPLAASCTHVRAKTSLTLVMLAVTQFLALVIWRP